MILDELKDILSDQLDIDKNEIEITSRLADDLGMDSLDVIDLAMSVEDSYSIEMPDSAIIKMKTVEDVVVYIKSKTE
ncbi:MAG: acyl carrier protein [Eubacterium sp.]|nr:acyl carrier protein [Eubacterium sp.]